MRRATRATMMSAALVLLPCSLLACDDDNDGNIDNPDLDPGEGTGLPEEEDVDLDPGEGTGLPGDDSVED